MRTSTIAAIARRAGAAPSAVSRRKFLETTLAAGAGLWLGGQGARADSRGGKRPRVIIVGAGFGGLSCGWQLQQAGAQVTILEARNRLGGRVLSLDRYIPDAVVEGGAELIGSNHPTWMQYGKAFGLTFRDVTEPEPAQAPILLNGKRYEGKAREALWESMWAALNRMNDDARLVDPNQPWSSPDAARFDAMNVAEVIQSWPIDTNVKEAALAVFSNDDAGWPERTSYLGTLSVIAGGGYEKFWTESEVYRCEGGNQTLAFKLAEAIGDSRIHLQTPVSQIELTDSGASVKTADGNTFGGDVVVLTVPPSAWDHFTITPELPSDYRVDTGPAIKYLAKVDQRFWVENGWEPNSLSDTPVGETWDGTDGQLPNPGSPACLTVFSGGAAAQACLDFPADQRKAEFARYLEQLYPGFNQHFQKGMFMGWPTEKWTQCGYSGAAPGQVTTVMPKLRAGFQDRLFFAGEYTSTAFTGYMEGGLHSGAMLAKKLAKSLNLTSRRG